MRTHRISSRGRIRFYDPKGLRPSCSYDCPDCPDGIWGVQSFGDVTWGIAVGGKSTTKLRMECNGHVVWAQQECWLAGVFGEIPIASSDDASPVSGGVGVGTGYVRGAFCIKDLFGEGESLFASGAVFNASFGGRRSGTIGINLSIGLGAGRAICSLWPCEPIKLFGLPYGGESFGVNY